MRKLYCWFIARWKFNKFLDKYIYLKRTITMREKRNTLRNLAEIIYSSKYEKGNDKGC